MWTFGSNVRPHSCWDSTNIYLIKLECPVLREKDQPADIA